MFIEVHPDQTRAFACCAGRHLTRAWPWVSAVADAGAVKLNRAHWSTGQHEHSLGDSGTVHAASIAAAAATKEPLLGVSAAAAGRTDASRLLQLV